MSQNQGDNPRDGDQIAKTDQPSEGEAGAVSGEIAYRETQELSYSGPLPPPALLESYDRILPGAAERIFVMAEKQSDHRQALEKTIVNGDAMRANAGLLAGLVVALTVVISAVILISNGHDWAGATMATGVVVALTGIFVYGSQSRKAERLEKAQGITPDETTSP